ncbi:MAG: GDP-mannose 4,6-dehydratase [Deltaproteobacteria bacterium]|nr:GDP-mannose 4,6-dehydratase [Deltaproteobacteria bacterium]
MSRYAIIGGGGVFAIHFAKYLLEQNSTESVLSIGRNPPKSSAFTLDIGKEDSRFKYEQVHLVFEQDRLFELFDQMQPKYIVNFAALAYATSWEKSFRYYETNVVAVAKMCEQLMKRDYLERFIQIGTSELYGSVTKPADEDYPIQPTSPYAVSKLAADMHLETLWQVKKFPMNIIRPSNAYAPGQLMYRILPRAVYAGLTGQKLPLQGGGLVKKSYMHAYDLARAIDLVMKKAPFGKIYNVGPQEPVSIRHLVRLIAEGLGMELDQLVDITPGRVGEDSQYWLDSSRIQNELGYREAISIERGIQDMIDWGKRYLPLLHNEPMEFVLRA